MYIIRYFIIEGRDEKEVPLVRPAAAAPAGEDGMNKGRLTVDGKAKDSQSCPSTIC